MLSRAAEPIRLKPYPAPRMATPAPMPAPKLAPDITGVPGVCASRGEADISNTITTRPTSRNAFMAAFAPAHSGTAGTRNDPRAQAPGEINVQDAGTSP